ncbi:hypothetical protein [Variovorax sp. JS1663]|uniref:hypothetical protein n=1 Tax=Variovorax sp. JS1663 TaxID=1851577 RepID=UPI000B342F4D|nr:hypothetical protein [Variovorax sp. JS1663]OUL98520.1 hypothetical protein A8M77_31140 [Variovorax sp. JS1663]
MSIRLHIEELVVDGTTAGAHEAADLRAALQGHLLQLLQERGLPELAGGPSLALHSLQAPAVEAPGHGGARALGEQIAVSIHAGLAGVHAGPHG